jgi:hypothetical protein
MCCFAFEYHLQYELSKSPLFVILPNLREKKMQFLVIHVFTVELYQRFKCLECVFIIKHVEYVIFKAIL